MCQEHSRCGDIHNRDPLFRRDGLEEVLAMRRPRRDPRPFTRGIARVQDVNRNIFLNRWKHCRRMQNLGAEVCQFRGLVEADDLYAPSIGANIRIGGHHSVDIGPDFNPLCA